MSSVEIYCITDKVIPHVESLDYNIVGVSKSDFPENYLKCNTGDNIFYKEKYYSELTFHYWYWKNKLSINNNNWVGFCQKRRFWLRPESKNKTITKENLKDHLIQKPLDIWSSYETILCEPINLFPVKKMKMLKRGLRSLILDPMIFFDEKKQTIKFHFDMHHGYSNLDKAIDLLNDNDREEFRSYVNTKNFYNPHIMFISKSKIINEWFSALFPWLENCEEIFSFKELEKKYDTQRIFAFLAERYLSFWFKKYTNFYENPWVFLDNK